MNIEEKSKEYAKGKVQEALTSAIEKAYIDGFNDGLKYHESQSMEDVEKGVTFVDLELPSGTLWASHYLKDRLPYKDASKLSIPTIKQYQELFSECFLESTIKGLLFTGKNGNKILIEYRYVDQIPSRTSTFYFWLKDYVEGDCKYCACQTEYDDSVNHASYHQEL